MNIYPAIDLYEGKAVRLVRGDYAQMTVYSDDPASFASEFCDKGASYLHMVDLEGAKSGTTPNLELISEITARSGLFCEVGGGIRTPEIIEKYISAGVKRIILGSAAVSDPGFRREAISAFGERIAVGADILDGYIAIHGWQEKASVRAEEFFDILASDGTDAVIVTDISRDGMLSGSNIGLYRMLAENYPMKVIASGGLSSVEDVKALSELGICGAILGKAMYEGRLTLADALAASGELEAKQ